MENELTPQQHELLMRQHIDAGKKAIRKLRGLPNTPKEHQIRLAFLALKSWNGYSLHLGDICKTQPGYSGHSKSAASLLLSMNEWAQETELGSKVMSQFFPLYPDISLERFEYAMRHVDCGGVK